MVYCYSHEFVKIVAKLAYNCSVRSLASTSHKKEGRYCSSSARNPCFEAARDSFLSSFHLLFSA